MKEQFTIRPLKPGDALAVRQLDRLILGRDRSATWDAHVERFLQTSEVETLPDAPFGSHIAEWRGKVVGFILSEFQSGEYGLPKGAWIIAVGVHPEMRRAGLGKAMVNAVVEQCRKHEIEEVYAVVRPGDDRIADFLRRSGLEPSRVSVFGRKV